MNIIVEAVNAFLHLYIGYLFLSSFLGSARKKRTAIITIACNTVLLTVSLLLFKGSVIMYVPMTVLTFVLTLLFENKLISKIICTFLYLVIPGIVEMIVAFSVSSLFKISLDVAKENTAYFISGMLISKFIVFLIVLFIRTKKQNNLLKNYKIKYLSIFLFPASTLAVAAVQHKIFLEYPDQDVLTKYWVLVSYTILILANIIVFDFIDSLYSNTVNESRMVTANEIIENQKEQYKALIEHNREIAQIQHDNKHLFFGLLTEMKKGNYEAVIDGLSGAYEICEKEVSSDSIIESIVNIKKKEALERGINIEYECRHLRDLKVSSMDIAIVLGNALDNAIEACTESGTKQAEITLYVALKGETLVILIKNPVKDNVDVKNLITKKENAERHGFGVLSMKQIAKKYDGDVVFKCEDNLFTTTIVMSNTKL